MQNKSMFKSLKTHTAYNLQLHSGFDSESDDPERHTIARGQVKSLAHKLQQTPNKYPVGTAKMNLPLPDTTSK